MPTAPENTCASAGSRSRGSEILPKALFPAPMPEIPDILKALIAIVVLD